MCVASNESHIESDWKKITLLPSLMQHGSHVTDTAAEGLSALYINYQLANLSSLRCWT